MQLLIRHNPLQGPSKFHQFLLIIEALGLGVGVSGFEVLFTIETGSFDKGVTGWKRRTDEYQICREAFLLLNVANIPDNHLAPFYLCQLPFAEDVGLLLVVQRLVGFVTLVVLVA